MALPNNTFASPGNAYYALKGELVGAQDWYQYPALNGKIELVDASGTQLLQSIDGNLFYNNELLAKANDIQDIADWSLYPAIATVELAGQNITQVNRIDASSLVVTDISAGTIETKGDIYSAFPGNLYTTGINIRGDSTVPSAQTLLAGSVSTTGVSTMNGIQLPTSSAFGIDLNNNQLKRVSSVAISNSGFAPYGSLTSPDGVQLTWNGAAITTGAGGNVSQWANFPAVATVNANSNDITNAGTVNSGNVIIGGGSTGLLQTSRITSLAGAGSPALSVTAYQGLTTTADAGNIVTTAGAVSGTGNISTTAKGVIADTAYGETHTITNNFEVTCNGGLNPLTTPNINLIAENGNGGQINITANPGSVAALGGAINITANGGTVILPTDPPTSVTVGGEVNIFANTGSGGLYTLTSAVNIAAAGVNTYAGAIPPVGSLAGYNFIYGTTGVSICAGLPASGFQLPFTTYLYGVGSLGFTGVRLQSPNGIGLLSDTYATNLYPLDGTNLTIQGRSAPNANVTILDCDGLTMTPSGNVNTDFLNSLSGVGIFYKDSLQPQTNQGIYANFLKPPQATAPGVPNLTISGNAFGGNNNYVNLANVGTLAFDATASGALTGVQSINGAAWPPPTGDASLWSQYPATSIIDVSGYGLTRVGDLSGVVNINGSAYPPAVAPSTDWSLYPALQDVDISGYQLLNVQAITMPNFATITSAGSLGLFADTSSGNISIATNGGGSVNIGTGNAGDINIQTIGAGNDLNLGGDTASITAAVKINLDTPILDVVGADIQNVSNITNESTNLLTVQSTANLTVSAETALTLVSDSADVTVQGQTGVSVYAATGNVSLTADSGEIIVQDSVLNMNTHKITNLTSGTVATDAVNYGQLTFRDSTEFYVSAQGSDTSGNGSILAPFQTIQAAITAAELISSAAQVCVINVASGHYTENLTFSRGYISLNGSLQSQTGNEVCEITGSINIAVTGTSDLFNRQISFQGFNLTCGAGQAITDTSTTPHIVSFQDCKCFVVNQFFVSTGAFSDGRLYLTNVEIQQTLAGSTSPVIVTNLGQIELERVDISLSGNCSAIVIGGTSILSRFSLSALDTTNTGATLLPMLSFTSNTTSTHTLGNVAFAYSSATTKANTSAVYIASGVNTILLMLNNVFSLQGTSASTNYTVGYDLSGSPAILGVNNTSLNVPVLLPQTTAVQTGITQIAYTDINPPVMGAYSKSGDQTIAAANTPVAITFNTTQFQQGTALATTRLQVSASGNYQINYQVQTQASVGAIITTFLSKNGTALPNTGSQYTSGTGSQAQTSPQFIISLNSGDYIELYINSNALGVIVNSTAAAAPLPAIPGAIITITQIR